MHAARLRQSSQPCSSMICIMISQRSISFFRVAQVLIGRVFIMASAIKLSDSSLGASVRIHAPDMLSLRALGFRGHVFLADWEIAIGLLLIVYPNSRVCLRLAILTLIVFVVALIAMLFSGQQSCGCLGSTFRLHPSIPLVFDLSALLCLWRRYSFLSVSHSGLGKIGSP